MKHLVEADHEKWLAESDHPLPHVIVEPLMKSAARHAKTYASDLYFDLCWMSRDVRRLAKGEYGGVYRYAIGFRDGGGVDGPQFIKSRLGQGMEKTYKVLYIFAAEMVEKFGITYCHMILYRLDAPKMRLWLSEHFDDIGNQWESEFHKKED